MTGLFFIMEFFSERIEAFLSSQQEITELFLVDFDFFETEGFVFDGGLVLFCLGVFDRILFFQVETGLGVMVFEGFAVLLKLDNLFFGAFLLGRVKSRQLDGV